MSDDLLKQSLARLESNSDQCLQRLSTIEEKVSQLERVEARKAGMWGAIWAVLVSGASALAQQFYFKDIGK